MNVKLTAIELFCLLFISMAPAAHSHLFSVAKSRISASEINPMPKARIYKVPDDSIYSVALTKTMYSNIFRKIRGSWVTIKAETVAPENLEEVNSLTDLPEDLRKDFIEKNRSKGRAGKAYDLKYAYDVKLQKGSLESFFKQRKQQQPRLQALVGLSKVGLNSDNTQALIYIEYYDPENKLQKKYLFMSWKDDNPWQSIEKWF